MENEKELFKFLKLLVPDLERLSFYSTTDCWSEKKQVMIELKCRKKHYPIQILQRDKYEELIKYPKCRYIISSGDGIYSWDLKTLPEPEWYVKSLPMTSERNHNNDYIPKEVCFLDIKDAKKL